MYNKNVGHPRHLASSCHLTLTTHDTRAWGVWYTGIMSHQHSLHVKTKLNTHIFPKKASIVNCHFSINGSEKVNLILHVRITGQDTRQMKIQTLNLGSILSLISSKREHYFVSGGG